MKADEPYISHILDAIRKIKKATGEMDKKTFSKNELVREYTVRKLEIIGEAVKHISDKTKRNAKEIEWNRIAGMRDKLIHHYMGVDYRIIWDVVEWELPLLEKKLKELNKGIK
ncbi:MAG: DUF86 domain-containing protein [Candidatus Micrarchaeia archaeon]